MRPHFGEIFFIRVRIGVDLSQILENGLSTFFIPHQYRELGRTGIQVSEIGMGCEGFVEKSYEQVKEFVDVMEEAGVNCIDLYAPNPDMRSNLGRALEGRREKFVLQAHLCAVWKDGQYKRTRKISEVKEGFEDQLQRLRTDHVEIGMVHYVDSLKDWETVLQGDVMK